MKPIEPNQMISPYLYPSFFMDGIDKDKIIELQVKKVCRFFNIELEQIKERNRSKEIVEPRQMAMVILSKHKLLSHGDIAKYFNMNRTSVIDCREKVVNCCSTEPDFKQKFEELKRFVLSTAN